MDDRLSAGELLQHSWIKKYGKVHDPGDEEIKEAMINIQKFSKANKFQRSIISILLGLRPKQEDIERIRRVFKYIDSDSNGSIDPKEIKLMDKKYKVLEQGGSWTNILNNLDLDGNKMIDFHEFFIASVKHDIYLNQKNIDYVFQTFDRD